MPVNAVGSWEELCVVFQPVQHWGGGKGWSKQPKNLKCLSLRMPETVECGESLPPTRNLRIKLGFSATKPLVGTFSRAHKLTEIKHLEPSTSWVSPAQLNSLSISLSLQEQNLPFQCWVWLQPGQGFTSVLWDLLRIKK